MKIKKYQAPSLKEGKNKILEELGSDAVILSSRTVKSSSENGDSDSVVEIIAAVDNKKNPVETKTKPVSAEPKKHNESEITAALEPIKNELSELISIVEELSESGTPKKSSSLTPEMKILFKKLRNSGYSEKFSNNIIKTLEGKDLSKNLKLAERRAKELILEKIDFLPPINKTSKRQIFYFVGPTGAGKTLSLVKLATISKLVLKANPLIVCCDSEKIGGADQLQTYAAVANINFENCYSTKELDKIIEKEQNRDLVFIDTTGRSQNDEAKLKEIKLYSDLAKEKNVFIVLSGSTDSRTLNQVIEKYSILNPDGIILTKLDEAYSIGGAIETIIEAEIPLIYLTTGQEIPDDIESASKDFLSKFVISDNAITKRSRKI